MLVSAVVAMARNRVIGRANALPWRLPEDLKRFKRITLGKPVLMGRRTFESIGKPLPQRTNLVLTRQDWTSPGAVTVHSVQDAMARAAGAAELACIGGAEVFELLLPLTRRIHLTRIEADVPGDTLFPALDPAEWREVDCSKFAADERNSYDLTFLTLERVGADAR
jgi:dihydrofolate reductase